MRFIPDYRVCYKGTFYECDEEFDIDPADADEMSKHGKIVEESTPPDEPAELAEPDKLLEEKPKRGRRRKNDEPGTDEAADG